MEEPMFTLANFAAVAIAAAIAAQDPFQNPDPLTCGTVRSLPSVVELFSLVRATDVDDLDDWLIMDDVIMNYWESRDDSPAYWTPLCSTRSDLVRVGR